MSHDHAVPVGLSALEDEYEILSEIGRGGVSVVYLARDRILGREVAIKVTRDRFLEDDEARLRTDNEARTLAQLHHPNIVTILGARRLADGSLALIMQLARGRTLRECLREVGLFPWEAALTVLRQTAAALGYLHERGIVHRDVKPDNIFVEEDGRILLSDLGIAKSSDAATSVTLTGVVVGTPAYMSPEQIDGETLDGRSDLYSLALVGHELLSGKRPWEGENLFKVIIKQKSEDLPSLETLRPDLPVSMRQALERAMAKDREERWRDLEEFLAHLEGKAWSTSWLRASAHPAAPAAVRATPMSGLDPTAAVGTIPEAAADNRRAVPAAVPVREKVGMRRWAAAAAITTLLLAGGAVVALALSLAGEPDQLATALLPAGAVQPAAGRFVTMAISAVPDLEPAAPAAAIPVAAAGPRPAPDRRPESPSRADRQAAAAAAAAAAREISNLPAPRPVRMQGRDAITEPPPATSLVRPLSVPVTTADEVTGTLANSALTPPALRNADAVFDLVRQSYSSARAPEKSRGTVILSLTIDERGRVTASEVGASSGYPELDALGLRVSRQMLFSPARRDDQPVQVRVEVPLTIQP
jgi:TonB family protein